MLIGFDWDRWNTVEPRMFDCEFAGCKAARRSWGFSTQWPWGFTEKGLTWIEMISESSLDGESLWLGTNPLHVNWNHVSICLYFSDHFFSSNLAKLLCACAWFTRQALAMRQDPRGIGWCLCRLFWCHVDEKTGWGWRRCWRGLQRFEIWWLQRFHDCFCCITDATCTVKICGNAQTSNPCTQT